MPKTQVLCHTMCKEITGDREAIERWLPILMIITRVLNFELVVKYPGLRMSASALRREEQSCQCNYHSHSKLGDQLSPSSSFNEISSSNPGPSENSSQGTSASEYSSVSSLSFSQR